jgi:hypothetical protein
MAAQPSGARQRHGSGQPFEVSDDVRCRASPSKAIDGIEATVRHPPPRRREEGRGDKELGYFLNNAPRMRYHWFHTRGLFTGSGVVEAGCTAVIGQRLKQSGMHWTVNGAILTLRCAEASSQWEPSAPPSQPDRSRLTSPRPKTILAAYKIDAHPSQQPLIGRPFLPTTRHQLALRCTRFTSPTGIQGHCRREAS